jgi:hypothetical protein
MRENLLCRQIETESENDSGRSTEAQKETANAPSSEMRSRA